MPAKSPNPPVPPTSRRSARQQRLANREANRQLARAGSRPSSTANMRQLMIWTGVAVVAAMVLGAAYLLTRPSSGGGNAGDPTQPFVVTPSDIPASGLTLGDPNAKVTIDAWEDFRCSYCFDFTTKVEPRLVENYIKTGKAKLVFHDFLSIDHNQGNNASRDAAAAARCAADQGKFWTMHDWLFANQSPDELASAFTQSRLIQIGQLAGMDMSRFQPCVEQGTHNAEVTAEDAGAPGSVKSNGTPSILVNGTLVPNQASMDEYYTKIAAAIDNILNPSPSPAASGSAPASGSAAPSTSAPATVTPLPTATPAPSAS